MSKSKAEGVDICGTQETHYIIRSDLGCYMKSPDFQKGEDLDVHRLHPSCKGGDHYLADDKNRFYIIRGNIYCRVNDLSTGSNAELFIKKIIKRGTTICLFKDLST